MYYELLTDLYSELFSLRSRPEISEETVGGFSPLGLTAFCLKVSLKKKTGMAPRIIKTIENAIIGCSFKLYIILMIYGATIRPPSPVPSIIAKEVFLMSTYKI